MTTTIGLCTWSGCDNPATVSKVTKTSKRVYARLCIKHNQAFDKASDSDDREAFMRTLCAAIGFTSKGCKQ